MIRPVHNPPNPWASTAVEWLEEPPPARLEIFEERAKSIVSENDSPDVGFRYSVNPYRGCFHACAYCYARPYHQYLDFGAGTDFERKIVVKVNAAELLRAHFEKKRWQGEPLAFSGITDCYQPMEAVYRVTRGCLEVCRDYRNPVSIVTKSALIRRDVDLLGETAELGVLRGVFLSIPFADPKMARLVEPNVPSPAKRFETLRILSEAGVPTGVSVSPIIPGLNESQVPEILERARDAGARRAFRILLRLPNEVLPVFTERITEAFPERAKKIINAIQEMRGGKMNESRWGERMKGAGHRWGAIETLFDTHCRKFGLNAARLVDDPAPEACTFRRPRAQMELF